jgi:transposase InsO family protein
MTTLPERQKYVDWINEAVNNGASKTRACEVAGLSIRTFQRWHQHGEVTQDQRPLVKRPDPKNKLAEEERQRILKTCYQEEYAGLPPCKIVPMLADKGIYIASESSFYRVLKAEGQLTHRGRAKPKGTFTKPTSYVAKQANEVWSWDITYLKSCTQGHHYYLYMIEDIYSRKIVGWEVHESETGEHAAELLQKAVWSEKCVGNKLVLHSDNGSPMKSFTLQAKMFELGITPSRSRPRVSNDNPFSESLFRTLKYDHTWPISGFPSIHDARQWVSDFVCWYNNEHLHSGIKFVTPQQRHSGQDTEILGKRSALYEKARQENPVRWAGPTRNWTPDKIVELNPMKKNALTA